MKALRIATGFIAVIGLWMLVMAPAQDLPILTRPHPPPDGVWLDSLDLGTMAVGLFNRSPEAAMVTAKFPDLGISGSQPVRDLWIQKDLGRFSNAFSATVPRHGVVLVKIGRPKN